MLVELSCLPQLPELVHYAGRPGEWVIVPHGDVEPYRSHDLIFIPVCVEHVTGYYCVQMHKVFSGGRILSPTGFETLGGKEGNRKWRLSLRILMLNGHKGKTLGKYLVDHNLDHLVPNRSSSVSDGDETSPEKQRHVAQRGRPVDHYRGGARRNAMSASPVKKTSSMKKYQAGGHMRRRRTKSADSYSSSKEKRQIHVQAMAQNPLYVSLPVVCSGTPVTCNTDMPRPLEQPSPPLGTWDIIRRPHHNAMFGENETDQSNTCVSDYLEYHHHDVPLTAYTPHDHQEEDGDFLFQSFDLKNSEQ